MGARSSHGTVQKGLLQPQQAMIKQRKLGKEDLESSLATSHAILGSRQSQCFSSTIQTFLNA